MKNRNVLPLLTTFVLAAAIIGAGVSAPVWMEKAIPSYQNSAAVMEYADIKNVWERQQKAELYPWNLYDEKKQQKLSAGETADIQQALENFALLEFSTNIPADWAKDNGLLKIQVATQENNGGEFYYFIKDGRLDLLVDQSEYVLTDFVFNEEGDMIYMHFSELIDAKTNKPVDVGVLDNEIYQKYSQIPLDEWYGSESSSQISAGVFNEEMVMGYIKMYDSYLRDELWFLSSVLLDKMGQGTVSSTFALVSAKENFMDVDILQQDGEVLMIHTLEPQKKRLALYYRVMKNGQLYLCGYSLESLSA